MRYIIYRSSDLECDDKKDPGEISDSDVPTEQRSSNKKKKRKHKHHKHKKDKIVDKLDSKSDKDRYALFC